MSSNLDRGSEKEGVEKVDTEAPKESQRFSMHSDTRELEDAVRSTLRETDGDASQLRRLNRRMGLLGEQLENIELLQNTILESTDKMILAQTMMMRRMEAGKGIGKHVFESAEEEGDEKEGGDSWLKTAGIVGGTLLARSIFTKGGLAQVTRFMGYAKKAIPFASRLLPGGLAVGAGIAVLNRFAPKGVGAQGGDAAQSAEDGAFGSGVAPTVPALDGKTETPAQLQSNQRTTSLDPKSVKTDKPIRFETTDTIKFKASRIRFESVSITGLGTQSVGRPSAPSTMPNSGSSAVDVYRPGENRDAMIQEGLGGRSPSAPARDGSYSGSGSYSGGSADYSPTPGGSSAPQSSGPQYTPIPDQKKQFSPIPSDRGFYSPIPRQEDRGKGAQAYLTNARKSFADEIAAKPHLKDYLSRLMKAEHSHPAFAESMMNRVELIRKETGRPNYGLEDYLKEQGGKFYGPIKRGTVPKSLGEKDRAKLDGHWDSALAGSDYIKGATDQGSGNDPNVGHQGGRVKIGGEIYNDWGGSKRGHRASREWREERRRAVAQAEMEKEEGPSQSVPREQPMAERVPSKSKDAPEPWKGQYFDKITPSASTRSDIGRRGGVVLNLDTNWAPAGRQTQPMVVIPDNATPAQREAAQKYAAGIAAIYKRQFGQSLSPTVVTRGENGRGRNNTIHTEPYSVMDTKAVKFFNSPDGIKEHAQLLRDSLLQVPGIVPSLPHDPGMGDNGASGKLGNEVDLARPLLAEILNPAERKEVAAQQAQAEPVKAVPEPPVPLSQRGITAGMSVGRFSKETMQYSTDKMNLVGRFSKETMVHSAEKMVPGRFAEYAGGEKLRHASHTMPSPDNEWVSKQPQFDPLDPAVTKAEFNSGSQQFTEPASPQAKRTMADYDDFIGDMHPDPEFNDPTKAPPIVPKKRKVPGDQDNHNRSDD